MTRSSLIADGSTTAVVRYTEALAIAAAFLHGGQDLMRGEPAALGIPPWLFAGGFFLYAVLVASVGERSTSRLVLTGGVPVGIGVFHLVESHHGGFFMPITYATILFGSSTVVAQLLGDRDRPAESRA